MVDLKKLQKQIYQNKVNKGFNVTDINEEFCLTYGEPLICDVFARLDYMERRGSGIKKILYPNYPNRVNSRFII